MRDTVLALVDGRDPAVLDAIRTSVADMVRQVGSYVPGYRLKQEIQFLPVPADQPVHTLTGDRSGDSAVTHQVSVFLEVEGAAHYLPAYAGNLDIMTSAALQVAERIAARSKELVR
jgi:acetaldehyde dehydrogenase